MNYDSCLAFKIYVETFLYFRIMNKIDGLCMHRYGPATKILLNSISNTTLKLNTEILLKKFAV